MSTGNRHWQDFLAAPGHAYIEIQGGLEGLRTANTEPCPAGAQWSWLEAYGMLEADPKVVHGPWANAYKAVEQGIDQIISHNALEELLTHRGVGRHLRPEENYSIAEPGWGALMPPPR